MPLLDFTEHGGQKFLPLNAIVFFIGRLGWVEDRSLSIDLSAGLSPATLSKFEAWAVADCLSYRVRLFIPVGCYFISNDVTIKNSYSAVAEKGINYP